MVQFFIGWVISATAIGWWTWLIPVFQSLLADNPALGWLYLVLVSLTTGAFITWWILMVTRPDATTAPRGPREGE